MKRFPPLIKYFVIFIVALLGLLIYSKIGPRALPKTVSPWSYLSDLTRALETREVTLAAGEAWERIDHPFYVTLERANNAPGSEEFAFYLLYIEPLVDIPMIGRWLKNGLALGLIDTRADRSQGKVQLVAMKKIKQQADEE